VRGLLSYHAPVAYRSAVEHGPSNLEVLCEAAPEVQAALDRLGRTEDLRFSPSNRCLAVAGFTRNLILVIGVEISSVEGGPRVRLTDVVEVGSPELENPHGLDFLDDDTLLVANRGGGVSLVHLPAIAADAPGGQRRGAQRAHDVSFALLDQPGSVLVADADDGGTEVLVCNNAGHTVTRHLLRSRSDPVVLSSEVLLRRWLEVPDGVTTSPDGHWLAVSNHGAQMVMLYERSPALHEASDPTGLLRGVSYPHGMRFSGDGLHLFVADAGAPFVHLFARQGPSWTGVQHPTVSLRVMDDDTFQRGRYNDREGGPKGLDLDQSGRVLAVTSEFQPLAFFDVEAILTGSSDPARRVAFELDVLAGVQQNAAELTRTRRTADLAEDRALAAEQRAAESEALRNQASVEARHLASILEAAEANIAAIEATKTFRVARPFRRLYAALRARR
jgi:hypothetical protein